MRKIVLASAVAAIMASGSAFADTTVYGKAHAALVSVDNTTTGQDNWEVTTNASRLGFKGSEDLGNGMSAIYQYELDYDLDDGTGFQDANRNSFVGLKGGFGTVLIGRHDSPAKGAFYGAGNEHLGDSVIDLNGSFSFREDRNSNVIMYKSNDMNGLAFTAAIAPGEGDGTAAGDGLADGTSVAVTYKSGPVKVGVGFLDEADLGSGADNSVTNVGGSYAMGDLSLGLQYQVEEKAANDVTIFALAVAYKMGNNKLIFSFGNNDDDTTDADVTNLGFASSLSKRTTAYVAYSTSDEGGELEEVDLLGIGLVHSF